jgi:hypothetical protein
MPRGRLFVVRRFVLDPLTESRVVPSKSAIYITLNCVRTASELPAESSQRITGEFIHSRFSLSRHVVGRETQTQHRQSLCQCLSH